MVEIIGVRFNSAGKIYYFNPKGEKLIIGTKVLVETARGVEMGHVVVSNKEVQESEIVPPLRDIVRVAGPNDFKTIEENKEKEKEAYKIAMEQIRAHAIDMKLVDVEYTFDRSKVLFYFTADGRVDFRELVKSLAAIFHTRIELRQIGVRDEARQIGSYGICGRNLCCGTFLDDFRPVSIKMAKEQGLSLNPTKISGTCGRLMCCLQYEQDGYEYMLKKLPRKGDFVDTPSGKGVVVDIATLKGEVRVKFGDGDDFKFEVFKADELKFKKHHIAEEDAEVSNSDNALTDIPEDVEELVKDDVIEETEALNQNAQSKNERKQKNHKPHNHKHNKKEADSENQEDKEHKKNNHKKRNFHKKNKSANKENNKQNENNKNE